MDKYTHQLVALQPPGKALPRHADSNWVKLLGGLAQELGRIDTRLDDLQEEVTLGDNATEMLDDWEKALGLPDPCAPAPTDINIRRARIRAKLSSVGGQSIAYFTDVLRNLGFLVTIKNKDPFLMGISKMGDSLGGYEWSNTWQISVPGNIDTDTYKLIKCVIDQIKPAHTAVLWGFGGRPPMPVFRYNGQFTFNGQAVYGGH